MKCLTVIINSGALALDLSIKAGALGGRSGGGACKNIRNSLLFERVAVCGPMWGPSGPRVGPVQGVVKMHAGNLRNSLLFRSPPAWPCGRLTCRSVYIPCTFIPPSKTYGFRWFCSPRASPTWRSLNNIQWLFNEYSIFNEYSMNIHWILNIQWIFNEYQAGTGIVADRIANLSGNPRKTWKFMYLYYSHWE